MVKHQGSLCGCKLCHKCSAVKSPKFEVLRIEVSFYFYEYFELYGGIHKMCHKCSAVKSPKFEVLRIEVLFYFNEYFEIYGGKNV